MSLGEVLGFIGGALTTCGFVPQVIRVYRLRSAREISLTFTVLFTLGIIFWIAYGVFFRLPSVILWNAITLALAVGLLVAKLKYGREKNLTG